MIPKQPGEHWTVEEAQQWLPDILRLAETDGVQRIKTADSVITITAHPLRHPNKPEGLTLGQALVKYMPRGENLVTPRDQEYERKYLSSAGGDSEIGENGQ